ncbi:ATP-binding protein [Actinomadura hibisca]|uniref:ATP-binding protein n=1 Tax=Actinomadura hibisca TaxID=68565 RepID=UPI000829F8C7|nr:ATP-binding protein [Actinomadura hibisca]
MYWTLTYPGLLSMVPAIRAFVRSMLADTPRLDDAGLVVSEFAANAMIHTPSGGPGGTVVVAVTVRDGWARVAVSDAGPGDWTRPVPTASQMEEYGRGLLLVEAFADKVGHEVVAGGQTMWAEFGWTS